MSTKWNSKKEYMAWYYREHKEQYAAYNQIYRRRCHERIAAYNHAYYEAHKEKYRDEYNPRSRARQKGQVAGAEP
jgi:hypothetical protein